MPIFMKGASVPFYSSHLVEEEKWKVKKYTERLKDHIYKYIFINVNKTILKHIFMYIFFRFTAERVTS